MLQEGGVKIWRPRQVSHFHVGYNRMANRELKCYADICWCRQTWVCAPRGEKCSWGAEEEPIAYYSLWVCMRLSNDIVTDLHLSHRAHGNNVFPSYSKLMSYCAGSRREQCWRHTRTNHRQSCNVDSILWGRLLCIWPISWITKQDEYECSTWKRWYNQFGNIWIIFGCTLLSNAFPFFLPSSLPLTACPATFNPLNFPRFFHSCKFKMYSTFFSVALFFVLATNAVLADFAVSNPEITAVRWPASYSE